MGVWNECDHVPLAAYLSTENPHLVFATTGDGVDQRTSDSTTSTCNCYDGHNFSEERFSKKDANKGGFEVEG